jgi:hypothetical protein
MSREEMERRLKFHEKRMTGEGLSYSQYQEYWRQKSEAMYWHYLDLLTR